MEYKTCPKCEGKGYINVQNGPDDSEQVFCENCGASGRLEIMPF